MFKKFRKNEKGFTLAELLIVVAIIGVLVAISIPIFTSQLKKARLATNQANARAAHAALVAELLDEQKTAGEADYTVSTSKIDSSKDTATALAITTDPSDWKVNDTGATADLDDKEVTVWTVSIQDNGTVTYAAKTTK